MSLLTTGKTLIFGVGKSPKDRLLLKVTVLRARGSTLTDNRLYHCLEKRLNDLSRESRIDWSNKLYESFWLGSPDDRGESVKSFTKLVVALFPAGTERRNYLSYPAKTEDDLLAFLEYEIFGVIVKQLSRKVELDDTTAFTILNRMAEHGHLTSLHVLNKLIEVGSRKDSKRTRAALFEFKNHVSDKLQYTDFGKKALSKLEALFDEAKETTAQLTDEPPDVKWITWNSVTRIVEFYQDISSKTKLGDNHLKALRNWAVQAVTIQGDAGHKRFMELKALFKANPDLKIDKNSSLSLEYDDLTHHGWTNYPPFLAELTLKLQNNVALLEIFRSLNDAQLESWFEWHKIARGLKSTSAPSQKWLSITKNLVKRLGKSKTTGLMVKLLSHSEWPPRVGGDNENTLRALIYATTFLPPRDVCSLLANFSEKCCYQTVQNLGIRNEKLGNWPAAGFTDTELRCFDGTGGFKWREGSSAASSSLRR